MLPDCAGPPCGRYASQIGRASTMKSARNANTATPRRVSLRVTTDWMRLLIARQLRLFAYTDFDLDQSLPPGSPATSREDDERRAQHGRGERSRPHSHS